jgi:hypothetical protein
MLARLPESLHTLYAELLDQALRADAEHAVRGAPDGSFVSKLVKGRRYWYLQRQEAGRKHQKYLGPETESLLEWIREAREQRRQRAGDGTRRAQLVDMLLAGGAEREAAVVVRVIAALATSDLFRRGGVLVGTQAFRCYGTILGVRLEGSQLRTQDVDLAYESSLDVALSSEPPSTPVLESLRQADPAFFPVPELDPRQPSTSFKVRGRDLRVDFLTPARGSAVEKPVWLPAFGVAATPLPMVGYLIEDAAPAVVLGGTGPLVNVPSPGRYALHKLWLAAQRPIAEQAKARKDRLQAETLLEVLCEDRPDEVRRAWKAMAKRPRQAKVVRESLHTGNSEGSRAAKALLF